ncbi:unnamed protein product [Prorocentrum cordatum]|uniref:Uncharacterized protein n=1 Tax=Prorocentrum cordatum TaxID=2364126 RepID=A0ABN9WX65_9DINO|nr:unnamed protein product [Polarella glacialis]
MAPNTTVLSSAAPRLRTSINEAQRNGPGMAAAMMAAMRHIRNARPDQPATCHWNNNFSTGARASRPLPREIPGELCGARRARGVAFGAQASGSSAAWPSTPPARGLGPGRFEPRADRGRQSKVWRPLRWGTGRVQASRAVRTVPMSSPPN